MKAIEFRARFVLVAALSAAVAACASIPAGTPMESSASATAPALAIGDSWTYRVRDGYTGLARPDQRLRVTGADPDRIRVAASRSDGPDEAQIFDREWNWLSRPATNLPFFEYSPAYRALSFPLAVGKTWRARATATDPRDGRRFPVWIEGTVQGWERIKVPAGEFEALKIRRMVYIDYWEYTLRGRSEIVEYEWYAPAVRQAVRREDRSQHLSYLYSDDKGPTWVRDDWLIAELVSYSVR